MDSNPRLADCALRCTLRLALSRIYEEVRGVLKTFVLLPGADRGLRFDRRVEAMIEDTPEVALIVRPLLATWRQLREQIAVFDAAVQRRVKADATCRLLMTVPGIGARVRQHD